MDETTHTVSPSEADGPPTAPDIERHVSLPAVRGVVVLVLAALVILALLGLFGESRGDTVVQSRHIRLAVEYPARLRYSQSQPMRVLVSNRSPRALDTVVVHFDPAYVEQFSDVSITPSPERPWEVELLDVQPGETRRILVGLQANAYGQHTGEIAAYARGADTARASVSTLVYP